MPKMQEIKINDSTKARELVLFAEKQTCVDFTKHYYANDCYYMAYDCKPIKTNCLLEAIIKKKLDYEIIAALEMENVIISEDRGEIEFVYPTPNTTATKIDASERVAKLMKLLWEDEGNEVSSEAKQWLDNLRTGYFENLCDARIAMPQNPIAPPKPVEKTKPFIDFPALFEKAQLFLIICGVIVGIALAIWVFANRQESEGAKGDIEAIGNVTIV